MTTIDGKDVMADTLALIREIIIPGFPPGTGAQLTEQLLAHTELSPEVAQKVRDSARINDAMDRLKFRPGPGTDTQIQAFTLSIAVEMLAKIAAGAIQLYAREASRDPVEILDELQSRAMLQGLDLDESAGGMDSGDTQKL